MKRIHVSRFLLFIVYPVLFITGLILCFTTCNSGDNKQQAATSINAPKVFVMPTLPDSLRQTKERAAYLVAHYWDHFDFADTTYLHLPEVTEQAFANYIEILPHTDKQTADASIEALLNKTVEEKTGKMYPYFCELFKRYLYEPNSPLRNDEFYIPVVRYIIADDRSPIADKERAKFALAMMLKNRIGETATNFVYTLSSGKTSSLHAIKSEHILVLFYNPDCHACEQTIASIKASALLSKMMQDKTLTVVSFYPDADLSIWKKHLVDIPTMWINGYDKQQEVKDKTLYDLKAIPSLYLLDSNKKVILKDTELPFIEEYFNKQTVYLGGK